MSDKKFHLVHANVAIMRAPLDHPTMAGFVDRMDEIDAEAERSEGYVAQPTPVDEGQVYDGRRLLNLSIWESVEALERFVHRGQHALALERRAEWFEQRDGPNYVLYWTPVGRIPSEAEVETRLQYLAQHGPTPFAFTFEQSFTAVEAQEFAADTE